MTALLYLFKVLVFPGIVSLLACGGVLVWMEERGRRLWRGAWPPGDGGEEGYRGRRFFSLWEALSAGKGMGGARVGTFGALAAAASLTALGAGMVVMVEARGDLSVVALCFAAADFLLLAPLAESGGAGEAARLPLAFRTAFFRATALLFVSLAVSLRFPRDFASSLDSFREETVFAAVLFWSGFRRTLVSAGLSAGLLAAWMLIMGNPSWEWGLGGEGERGGALTFFVRSAQLPFLLGAFVLIGLGYPGGGALEVLRWSLAALGVAAAAVVMRAWFLAGERTKARRLQALAAGVAVSALALMVGSAAQP